METSKSKTAQGRQDEIVSAHIQGAMRAGTLTNPLEPVIGYLSNPYDFCRNRVLRKVYGFPEGTWYFCGGKTTDAGEMGYCLDCEIACMVEILDSIVETKIVDRLDADEWCFANEALVRLMAIKAEEDGRELSSEGSGR